ncbi:MAG TPA: cupin domain-containing protein [Candidatus Mediterraneibacter intestinigallinarum]|nr:cupin domain-containing protein [Candidatus Mediterraneibacter intestinigallinarum]
MFICIAGRGKYQIGEKRYTFETGDVFVINNGELHKSEIIADMAFAGTEQTVQSRR